MRIPAIIFRHLANRKSLEDLPTSQKIHRRVPRGRLAYAAGLGRSVLVPTSPSTEPNYWCTWYSRNYRIGRGSDLDSLIGVTNEAAREELNEATLFNEKAGWATTDLPKGREDYIFLIMTSGNLDGTPRDSGPAAM